MNVFTIAPSRPFLPILVAALLDGRLVPSFRHADDPLALADATILVPTRRAARELRGAFLARLGGRAAILPRIRTLGDVDEDAAMLDEAGAAFVRDLSREVNGLERLLGLTRLVFGWSEGLARTLLNPATGAAPTLPASPAEAVHLARALHALIDQVETEGADWGDLERLVPEAYADWWSLTLGFLGIVSEAWPAFLAERGLVDPASRRNAAIRREAERLRRAPPAGPVIAAGSTGSIPATADLLAVIAGLPNGAVVLPGLDRTLDAASWDAIGAPEPRRPGPAPPRPLHEPVPGHPQYGLKLLLARLGASRDDVTELDPEPAAPLRLRQRALSEAMKPAETTESWRGFADAVGGPAALVEAFAGVSLIEARSEAEEALAIAIAMREVLEHPGRTAALVTPDRALARRVAAELGRWGLAIDDSAGEPLGRTPPAVLARLVAEVAVGGFDPVALVSLLEHPLAAFGWPRAKARAAARALEIGCLRGPRARPGSEGLRAAFDQARHEAGMPGARIPRARQRLAMRDWRDAEDLLDRLADALAPLEALARAPGLAPFPAFLDAHVAALRAVVRDETGSDARLFDGEAGEALAAMLAGLIDAARAPDFEIAFAGRDYPGFFDAVIGAQPVRRKAGLDRRLHIWGPLEARLQSVDRLILAGLDEGTWPATTRSDPWLSRPMKQALGLEPPERRIGLAAHDFAQGAAAPEVVLSRAIRAGSAPTVASRWLQRLLAVLGEAPAQAMRDRGGRWVAVARAIDRPAVGARNARRPAPTPPLEARPHGLSVTEIETWIRDPYAIYARHVLGLAPLDPLAAEPDGSDFGSMVHAVLARFMADWTSAPPDAAAARFMALAEDELDRQSAFPERVALWRPRLARIAAWFVGWEAPRAARTVRRILEKKADMSVQTIDGSFTLTGVADRIDLRDDGSIAILDYKTGSPPSAKQVRVLLAPQLPLEAAMVRQGAFGNDLSTLPITELLYVKLSGGTEPGEAREAAGRERSGAVTVAADDLAAKAHAKLVALANLYRNPGQGYASRPRVQFSRQTGGPYDHLARVKEWAAGEGTEGGEE